MTKVFDVLLLNLLCILCSIPVITGGASMTAMYYVMMKLVRNEEGRILKGFFKLFRENFRQSVPLTLLFRAVIGILAADFHILGGNRQGSASVMYGGCITLFVLFMAVYGYVFPLLARFENTVKNTLLNAARIAVTHLPSTIVILILNCVPFIWFLVSPGTFAAIFWIWLFAGTGAAAFVNSLILARIFDEFV